jgi:1,2-diacylglycerol 3-alpha-glucosyltransferase
MRIVIAGETYYPGANGQATFTIRLAEGLAQAGHHVMAIVPSHQFKTYIEEINGVQVQKIAGLNWTRFHPEANLALPNFGIGRILDKFQADVVHIQDHYIISHQVVWAARSRHIPLLGTNHFLPDNLFPYIKFLPFSDSFKGAVLWKIMLDVFNLLDAATTPTETAAKILRQQAIHIPVTAISNGIDTSQFYPDPTVDRAAMRLKYGLDPNRAVFLYVGRVDGEKGIEVLLEAFQKINRDDIQLAVAGRGAYLPHLKSMAGQLGLKDKVVFTGYIPVEDKPALINSADIFAMPSKAELQSIATLEAMASAKPVLAANARALPELVDPGVNGTLFKPDDASDAAKGILELLANRSRWPEMGQASLAHVQPHSLANTIARYSDLYLSLIEARMAEKETKLKKFRKEKDRAIN